MSDDLERTIALGEFITILLVLGCTVGLWWLV